MDLSIAKEPTYHKGKSEYDSRPVSSTSPPKPTQLSGPPHPRSYMEIMAMVQRGERPPNVRDIDDSLPDPNRPISNPRMAPRAKFPVERASSQEHVGAALATPIAMPEAAEAIQRTKATAQKELTDDQLMARTFEMSEESQKVTEISEYGAAVDALGSGMQTGSSSETREGPEST
ncbi:hypothetical protein MLD38_032007 [Melastoma candidum]|uniref:Uncharacterized protein n=1 Tax=Melastoma candidum TaxID=119954 RepID=A0ACB9MTB0_9MYRT|nr:hypothetical protein MLD38_032007 [Melastoma candidum]